MPRFLLGNVPLRAFLHDHWQKKPLLVRGAVPGFRGLIDRQGLLAAACRDTVSSRLVLRRGARWEVRCGPFRRSELQALPRRNWTLLVQEVNHFLPAADALMREFAFVPLARLDDVMVSLAPPGGGVGPHVDSYDVFLLQGSGRRRWRVSAQHDRELVPGAPLKILKRFVPEQEWVLEPGDMLYLPPAYAHDGIAVDECTTYSIGFRAPTAQEVGQAFLDHLRDTLALHGRYADPDLKLQRDPAAIGADMTAQIAALLDGIRWTRRDVARFLGGYLTEPKPHVFFSPPRPALSRARFLAHAARDGVTLALRSRMLFDRDRVYLNGETYAPPAAAAAVLRKLANAGALPGGTDLGAEVADRLHEWYRAGYVELQPAASDGTDRPRPCTTT
jgi:50S ribosomal protein L16 3-hydroxylase